MNSCRRAHDQRGDGWDGGARPRIYADVNAVVGGYLRDPAFAQSSQQKMFGYKRAAAAIFALDMPFIALLAAKYEQYQQAAPGLPVLAIDIIELRAWRADE